MLNHQNASSAWRAQEAMLRRVLREARGEAPTAAQTTGGAEDGRALAMVYAPKQMWQDLFDPADALARGTLFAALYLPFEGKTLAER